MIEGFNEIILYKLNRIYDDIPIYNTSTYIVRLDKVCIDQP